MASFDINAVARRVQHTVGSSDREGPYAFSFQVNAASELAVYQNDTLLTESTQYNSSIGATGSGSITFIDNSGSGGTDYTPTAADVITIIGDQPLSRTTNFQTGQVNQPATLETEFDNVLIRQQQLQEITDRSIQLKPSTGRTVTGSGTSGPLQFPYDSTVANNANRIVKFDSNGTALELGSTTTNIDSLATIASDISTVAGISSDISAVENIAANVTTVAGIASNVTSVVDISSDVTTVAGIASDVSAVENIAANVTTVAGISSDVTSVAGANTNISAVAGGLTNINTVAGAVANVNTVASNVAGVNSFADRYRVAGSAPSSSLDVGDLYFDTSSDTMKVYGGSGWQNAGSSVNGTSARFIFSVSSSTTSISGNDTAGNTLAYDAGFVDVWLNGVKMVNGTDVTVTSGNAIVFAVAIGTSGTDTVDVIAYGTFNVANVTSSSLASSSVTTAKIADDAVTVDKLANTINAEITANTAKVTNATHTGEVTGATALTIADNVVDEANLKVSNAPTNGYFLSAQSGDTGGLTWAEAAGGFSFNAVSGATPSLNVGSYNFFDNGTLAANTTVSFASVPTEANWKYTFEVGFNDDIAWDISNATYTRLFSVAGQATNPQDLFFKPDGTEMYVMGGANDSVYQYALSTAWDISSASYTRAFSVAGQEATPTSLFFKPDGTEMYVMGYTGDDVNQYTLSTAWDISSASYTRAFSISAQETVPYGLFFKSDGTEMYVTGTIGDDVNQYTLSTAWNISTASYTRVFSVAGQDTSPQALSFKSDGTEMYILGGSGDDVNQYTLSTAWDISTATYTRVFSVAAQENNVSSLFFKPDGTEMYVMGYDGDDVNQYTIDAAYTVSLPASIENPPTIPLVFGSRYAYDFFTKDGGTTVTLLSENKE